MLGLKYFVVLTFLLIALFLRFFFFYQSQPHYTNGQYVSFETTLFSEPKIFGNYQILSANLGTINKIFIKTNLYPKFHYQDTMRISGKIKFKTLENKRAIITIYFPKIEAVKKDKNLLLALTNLVRQKVILLFSKTLPPKSASLLLGIVFGIKEPMPKEFANDLRNSGVLHVIAASGMNVTMVGGFLSSVFAFFLRRQIALIASIISILFYAFLAGLEPSILRASIMGVLVFSAQILGRQSLALYGLFIAGFVMLFFSPLLLFDIGFQLSFFATLGLLYIRPTFEKNKKINLILKRSIIGENVTTTVAAQVATLPILLVNFGTYPLWSIVVNGLVLWTVPTLMIVGGVGAILGMFLELLGKISLYLSLPFLFYFEKIVTTFAGFGAVVKINGFIWQFVVSYYSLIAAFYFYIYNRDRK